MARAHARHKAPVPAPTPTPAVASATPLISAEAWRYVALYVAILVLLLAVYQPALHGGILWDDEAHITRLELRNWDGLWRIWFEPGATQQVLPGGALGLLGHGAPGWRWDARLSRPQRRAARRVGGPGSSRSCSASACLAPFAPPSSLPSIPFTRSRSRWITELKNTLSGFFCLSALLFYLRFDDTRRTRPYILALVFFVLALLTKSVTATLPAVILALAWLQRGRVDSATRRPAPPPLLRVWGSHGDRDVARRAHVCRGATGAEFELSFIERCLVAGRAVSFYFLEVDVAPPPRVLLSALES